MNWNVDYDDTKQRMSQYFKKVRLVIWCFNNICKLDNLIFTVHQFTLIAMFYFQNVALGEDIESSPVYVNSSAISRHDFKYFDAATNSFKRLSYHEDHPRRHHRNRLMHPIKKSLDKNGNDFRVPSSKHHSTFSNATSFTSEDAFKFRERLNAQPVRLAWKYKRVYYDKRIDVFKTFVKQRICQNKANEQWIQKDFHDISSIDQ